MGQGGACRVPLFKGKFEKTMRFGQRQSETMIRGWPWRYPAFLALAMACVVFSPPVQAQKIENPITVFAALDKVTARISKLEINIGETLQFGALTVTPRVCYSRPATEPPLTSAFVEVDEIKLSGEKQRIFTGWMFAQSPGLHAVEHPVFDVWLTNCKTDAPETSAGNLENSPPPRSASSNSR